MSFALKSLCAFFSLLATVKGSIFSAAIHETLDKFNYILTSTQNNSSKSTPSPPPSSAMKNRSVDELSGSVSGITSCASFSDLTGALSPNSPKQGYVSVPEVPHLVFFGVTNFARILELHEKPLIILRDYELTRKISFKDNPREIAEFGFFLSSQERNYLENLFTLGSNEVIDQIIQFFKRNFESKTFSELRFVVASFKFPQIEQAFLSHGITCFNPRKWSPEHAQDSEFTNFFIEDFSGHFEEYAAVTFSPDLK